MKNLDFKSGVTVLFRNENSERFRIEMARYGTLSDEQVRVFISSAKEGDADAMQTVIKSNLRFLWSVSKKYQGNGLDFEDLIQEGVFGIVNAVKSFDLNRRTRFSTWLIEEVRESLTTAITEKSRTVRMNKAQINAKNFYHSVSMEEPYLDDEEKTLADTFSSGDSASSLTDESDLKHQVMSLLNGLTDREKKVICGLFGIGCPEQSEYSLSLKYGICEERIRQIKWEAIAKMKQIATK